MFYYRVYSAPPRRTQWWSCRRKAGSGSTPPTNATTTMPLTGIRMLLVFITLKGTDSQKLTIDTEYYLH